MSMKEGYVNGIDVIASPNQPTRCLAVISPTLNPPNPDEIQVWTEDPMLHAALLAFAGQRHGIPPIEVEVTYNSNGPSNELTRIKAKDR